MNEEYFELACYRCDSDVRVPTGMVDSNLAKCPVCGAKLEVRWDEPLTEGCPDDER